MWSHLSVSQQGVHALKEARVQNIGLIHDEGNLLVLAARTSKHSPQVLIKVLTCVLPVHLWTQTHTIMVKENIHWANRQLTSVKHFITHHPNLCAQDIRYSEANSEVVLKPAKSTYLDLVHTEAIHPGHKAGQGCLPSAANSNEQQMTLRLAEDSVEQMPL